MILYLETIEFSSGKWFSAMLGVICSAILPVVDLIVTSFVFILIDFVVGVIASRARYKKLGKLEEWGFESEKMWNTVYKAVFVGVGIVMLQTLDARVLPAVPLNLANYFCGFVCAVEFWSFLEGAAIISNHPVFRWLRKYMGKKVNDVVDSTVDKLKDKVNEL